MSHSKISRVVANSGDTENDIIAARAISLPVIAVKSPYDGYDKLAALKPDFLLNSIRELPETIKGMNNHE